ncbi:MAG: GIY-YIG nuclease family protein [Patescibacteria group bacterium]
MPDRLVVDSKMYFLYILVSQSINKTYVGITDNLERRLGEHNSDKHSYTKRYVPWKIIYKEQLSTREEARKREKYFKSTTGRRLMKKLLKDIKK